MIDSDGMKNLDTVEAEQGGDVAAQDIRAEIETKDMTASDPVTAEKSETQADAENSSGEIIEPIKADDEIKTDAVKTDTANKKIADGRAAENNDDSDANELIGFGIKVVAVALSVVFLLISIFAVTLPFSAMKIYNQLGMYDRALESGERYINFRIAEEKAYAEDVYGNMTGISDSPNLSDDEFVEALDVVITLSEKLMKAQISKRSTSGAQYYAEKLERFTRMYACLSGVNLINYQKDSASLANMTGPILLRMRPLVYSYAHTIRKKNYSARAVLGKTDYMMYNTGRTREVMTSLTERTMHFGNTSMSNSLVDDYVDFIGEINAYIDYEFEKLSLNGVSLDETNVRNNYSKVLDGTQFALFINAGGFTTLYNELANTFTTFAQVIYDRAVSTPEERLNQLYQLYELTTFVEKMSGMSTLLYYNVYVYGPADEKIRDDYPSWGVRRAIFDGQQNRLLVELYDILMDRYVSSIYS